MRGGSGHISIQEAIPMSELTHQMTFVPGTRFELNEQSGNEGRKGFILFTSNTDLQSVLVRFDGFVYNSLTKADYIRTLAPEPFRPIESDE